MEFFLTCIINLAYSSEQSSDVVSTISLVTSSLIIVLVFIVMPLFLIYFLTRSLKEIESHQFEKMFGVLYEAVKSHSKITLAYSFFYILRRVLFCSLVFIAYGTPYLQIQCNILINLFMVSYHGYFSPRAFLGLNQIEFYNECTILFCSILMFTYFDTFVNDP